MEQKQKTKSKKTETSKTKDWDDEPAVKAKPTPKEEALAEIDRAVDPLIRAWKQATRDHATAKAEQIEANYNKALDAANIKYERWCKAHGEAP